MLSSSVSFQVYKKNIDPYLVFIKKYQNELLLKFEKNDEGIIDLILGFEKRDMTFSVVIDVNGRVKNIKFYCHINNKDHYKFKFDTGEENYINVSLDGRWVSVCEKSLYTEIKSPSTKRVLEEVVYLNRLYSQIDNLFIKKSCVFQERVFYMVRIREAYIDLVEYLNQVIDDRNLKEEFNFFTRADFKKLNYYRCNE